MYESDENYLKDVFHMFVENESAMKKSEAVPNDLSFELHTVEANGKLQITVNIPTGSNSSNSKSEALKKRKFSKVGAKIGAKVMGKVNVDIQDRLINGQTGNVRHMAFKMVMENFCQIIW